ncbi:tau 95 subunit of transcription factor TFIIIC [Entomortierella chlamydospora]|uniref:Tau 95 subunit of transcription factor TFIIIC n=1 Tax=Entomortierella chlamydospora TaxID=101097 RepID=A0A9P6T1R4_9FUNG|nr:tau 95 subunit of transcription factor TFIIIC [Entomortierella chlamydospora]
MAASNRKLSKIEQVPDAKFFSVEFPGHVENVNKALEALGGKRAITDAISTGNFLLKATRRYKVKRRLGSERSLPPYRAPRDDDVPYDKDVEYRFEVLGAIPKTVRFSGLADYQHIVDPKDEIVRIKSDLQNMEYENLISVKLDNTDPTEDISMTQLVPPGAISKSGVPHPFRYKARERDDAVKAKPGRKKKPSFRPKKQPGDLTGIAPVESNESGDDA